MYTTIRSIFSKWDLSLFITWVSFFLCNEVFSQNLIKADSVISINEVVVSASRFEQLKKETPQQIEIIDNRDISFQNMGTSASLLEQSGNVFVQKSQAGGGSPVLRGFEANKVLIVVDGVRLNNTIFRGGHLQNVLRIDQNMLERVEVVFGPSSVNYGSDALGGVMHFKTRDPKFNTKQSQSYLRYGTVNQEKTAHLNFNIGGEKLAFLTSLTFSDFGDVRMGSNYWNAYEGFGKRFMYQEFADGKDQWVENTNPLIQKASAYSQADILQKLSWKSKNIDHTINLQGSISSNVPRYDRLTELNDDGSFRFGDWFYGPEIRTLLSYKAHFKETKWYDQASFNLSHQFIQESRNTRLFNDIQLREQKERVHVNSANLDFQKVLAKHRLEYGAEYVNNLVNSLAVQKSALRPSTILGVAPSRYPDGGSSTHSFSLFLSDQWRLNQQVLLNGGVRYNYSTLKAQFDNKTFFPFEFNLVEQVNSALAGNLGVLIFPTVKSRIKLLGSTGFRTPNLDDLAKVFDSGQGTLVVPNPNIIPEKTYNFELGFSQKLGNKIEVEAACFYTFFEDALVIADFTLNGSPTALFDGRVSRVVAMQNQGRAKIQGWNASVTWKLNNSLKLYSTINETLGRLYTGVPLDHIPPLFGKTSMQLEKKKWSTELFALYNGWKPVEEYSPNGEDNLRFATADGTPSWWTLNIRSSYTLKEKLELQFGIENIFDVNYRNFASGISAPGRNVKVTVRVRW